MGNNGGNIVSGFENFLKNQTTTRRKYEVPDYDRVFSNSSITIQRVRYRVVHSCKTLNAN